MSINASKKRRARPVAALALACCGASAGAHAAVVYSQPHNLTGTIYQSSWIYPDGSDYDSFIWDSFIIGSTTDISEIRWRGGYQYGGMWSWMVPSFTVAIYPSIAAGSEPDVVHPPLVEFVTGNDANETPAGTFAGVAMYDYTYVLPAPFQAQGGVKYWLHIYADQSSIPEWGFAAGSGGNGAHFRRHSEYMFQMVPGDCAFTLISPGPACPADVNDSGAVDVEDLVAVITAWGTPGSGGADIDSSGTVDVSDLVAVILAWGACG